MSHRLFHAFAAALLAAGCASADIPGRYEGALPVGRDVERHVIVRLEPGGAASVVTSRWGSFTYLAEGAWKRADNRTVLVELAGTPPQRIVFQHAGNQLVAKEWDRAVWGEQGPGVLYRAR